MRPGLGRLALVVSIQVALLALVGCEGDMSSQAPPLGAPPVSPSSDGDGACSEPGVGGVSVVLFSSAGECRPGDVMVLYRCSPTATPVLRLASGSAPVQFLGGAFAVPVADLPANVRFVGAGEGVEVLVADSVPAATQVTSASAGPGPEHDAAAEPLVYVRRNGVTERWLPLPPSADVQEPPVAWLIGDSILDGGRDYVESRLGDWTLTIDAEVGRQSSSGIGLAEAAAAAGADVVLIELGTNDTSAAEFRGDLMETLDSLGDVPLVLWQTTRGPEDEPTVGEVSATIREVVPKYPNVSIADWEAFVPDDALQTDGIHPDIGSERLESQLLAPLLSGWRNAVSGEGATACGSQVLRETF